MTSVDKEWAIGFTQEEYDWLIHHLHYDANIGVQKAKDMIVRLRECRSSAIIHGVFEPTDKKSD